MADIQVKAELRTPEGTGKNLSQLRAARKIPGVVYGAKGKNTHVVVVERELLAAIKAGGANALIRLTHEKGEDTVIVKELQRHVVTNQPLHVDFQRVDLKKKITVRVPVHIVGTAPGVTLQGGVLEHLLRVIDIQCLPGNIPQRIDADISALEVGMSIRVKQLVKIEGADILVEPEAIVVHIVHAAEEEAAAAPGTEGAAEPELIAKGKKEEGEGEAAAGEAPKAEAGKKDAGKKDAGKKDAEKK